MVSLRALIVNAVVGLVILFIANAIGLGVQISLLSLLVCAIFGVPGAIIVILLAYLDIAFVAAMVPAHLWWDRPEDGYPNLGVQLLQELGLKEYEARCFIWLTRHKVGTAKELSDLTAVPRTRVYDAIRILETKGLVEVQQSSPRRYRAVSFDEATETLRDQ